MTPNLRVGIIGYGFATATFHAPLIQGTPGLELAAIASRDPGKVHAALPGMQVEASPEALWSRPDIDLIVIPTPNATHYSLASQALAAGKHVVVDKPFTVTLEEAKALKAQAERAGRLLSVFQNRRWDADFLTLRQVIASGVLGRIVHFESHFDRHRPQVQVRWRERPGAGNGLWFDLGPHLLDQAVQLFGMPEALALDRAAQREGAEVDDWFHAVLRYGPMRVVLHAGNLVPVPAPRFVVHGDRGTFLKRGLDPQEDRLKAGASPQGLDPVAAELTLWKDGAWQTAQRFCEPGNYPAYYAGIRDAILGRGPNPVTVEEAVAVMTLLEAGIQSCKHAD
jgi:predicted dehydrogenase